MQRFERMNAATHYIEDGILDCIDGRQASRITCCSAFHFQRIYACATGVSLGEYVRRRRMTLAAGGYARRGRGASIGLRIPSPPLCAPLAACTAYRRGSLRCRIERREGFRIVGLGAPLSEQIEENFRRVPKMWESAVRTGALARLQNLIQGQPACLLGVTARVGEAWRYWIAVASDADASSGLESCEIPATTRAIFPFRSGMPGAIA